MCAGSLLEFPPAIGYGRLFVATGRGVVLAFSTETGERAWSFDAHRCVAASPALSDFAHGTVYESFLNATPCRAKRPDDGEVIALSVGTAQIRWRRRIGASETSPVVADGRVLVGDWLGKVYALEERTGRIEWEFSTGGPVKGGVAV